MTASKRAKVDGTRSGLLTPRAREVLRLMLNNADTEDGVLVGEGALWWIGDERTSWQVAKQLLQLCLVRDISDTDLLRYEVNADEARRALDDPAYVPEIIRLMRAQRTAVQS